MVKLTKICEYIILVIQLADFIKFTDWKPQGTGGIMVNQANNNLILNKLRKIAEESEALGNKDLGALLKMLVVIVRLGETPITRKILYEHFKGMLKFREDCQSVALKLGGSVVVSKQVTIAQ